MYKYGMARFVTSLPSDQNKPSASTLSSEILFKKETFEFRYFRIENGCRRAVLRCWRSRSKYYQSDCEKAGPDSDIEPAERHHP
jgi:hypothetical protein